MKNFWIRSGLAAIGVIVVTGIMATTAQAQDDSEAERRARMEERRLEMEQRRAEYLENNPDAAARMEERRAGMRERFDNGDGRPRGPRPEIDGRRGPPPGGPGPGFERRRDGQPPGGPRFGNRLPGRGTSQAQGE